MNKKQQKVFWWAFAIILLLSLFPVKDSGGDGRRRGFVYSDKITFYGGQNHISVRAGVDLQTLIAQIFPVVLIGSALIISLKDKKQSKQQNSQS